MQTVTLSDTLQEAVAVTTDNFPILYSGNLLLRQSILRINELHTAEPIDTVAFDTSTMTLTVTLIDARVVVYTFEDLTPATNEFEMDFGTPPDEWLESSLVLLDSLKEGILILNEAFPLDAYDWESA